MQRFFLRSLMLVSLSLSACGPATDVASLPTTPTPTPTATLAATPSLTPAPPTATPLTTPTSTPLARAISVRPTPIAAPNCFAITPPAATSREYATSIVMLDANTISATIFNPTITRTTFYRSEDAGKSWTAGRAYADLITSMMPSPTLANDGILFALGLNGVYRSGDYGASWFTISPGNWTTRTPNARQLVVSPAFDQDRLILLGSQQAPRGVYAFSDGGARWSDWILDAVDALHISPNYALDHTVWISRKDERTFRRDVLVTTNQGDTWETVRAVGVRPLAISPAYSQDSTIIWEGYTGGLYVSRNSDKVSPLIEKAAAEVLRLWQPDAQRGWVIAGEQLISGLVFSPDFARDRTAFATISQALIITRDGGLSWSPLCYWGYNAQRPFDQLAISPDFLNDQTLFAGGLGARVAVSRDAGKTWTLTALKGN